MQKLIHKNLMGATSAKSEIQVVHDIFIGNLWSSCPGDVSIFEGGGSEPFSSQGIRFLNKFKVLIHLSAISFLTNYLPILCSALKVFKMLF